MGVVQYAEMRCQSALSKGFIGASILVSVMTTEINTFQQPIDCTIKFIIKPMEDDWWYTPRFVVLWLSKDD